MRQILKLLTGSHSFGTASETSDRDYVSIVIPSIDELIGLRSFKDKQIIHKTDDTKIISLCSFINSALKGKSEQILCLFGREDTKLETSPLGEKLWFLRNGLLSKCIIPPMKGFVSGQWQAAINGNRGRFNSDLGYDPKAAYHCVRVLYTLLRFQQSAELSAYLQTEVERANCIAIKNGHFTKSTTLSLIEMLWRKINETNSCFVFREAIDYDFWNQFVIDAHREAINEDCNSRE